MQVIAHRQRKRANYEAQSHTTYSVEPHSRSVSIPHPIGIGNLHCQGVDTTDFDPLNGDRNLIQSCVQMLKDGVKYGVETVKGILKRWGTDLRWSAVLELEEVAVQELRLLEDLVPQFYTLLSEEVLPISANG